MSLSLFLSYSRESVATHYESPTNADYEGIEYRPGEIIINLVYLDTDLVEGEYKKLVPLLLKACASGELPECYALFHALDKRFPCLLLYNDFYWSRFYDVFCNSEITYRDFDFVDYRNAVPDEPIPKEKTQNSIRAFLMYTVKVIMADIRRKKQIILNEVERIHQYRQDKAFASLSPEQKLYFLDFQVLHKAFSYTRATRQFDASYRSALIPARMEPFSGSPLSKNFAEQLLKRQYELVEAYQVETVMEWLQLEFYKLIMMDFNFAKCQYCDEFFILYGRKDLKYCDRIKEGETQPCREIGPQRVYHAKVAQYRVYRDFQRAYKRMYARHYNNGMTEKEFKAWSKEAQEKRQECIDGKMTLTAFNDWLGNKPKKGAPQDGKTQG